MIRKFDFKKKELIEHCHKMAMSYNGDYGTYKIKGEPKWQAKKHTQWYTIESGNTLEIVVQGSRNEEKGAFLVSPDWRSNFTIKKETIRVFNGTRNKWEYIKVHKGHYLQACSILVSLDLSKILEYKKIKISGHSAGGSIAQIFAILLHRHYNNGSKIEVVTAGSNRCFNRKAQKYFDINIGKHVRIVNGSDPVARYPTVNYYHTKNVIHIGQPKSLFYRIFMFSKWKKGLFDHSPADYVKNIQEYLR